MSIPIHDSMDLLRRISLRSLALLGTSAGGVAAQIITLTLTAAQGNWFKWNTWSNWRQTARKEFTRVFRAMALVWGVAFAICIMTTLRDDRHALEAKCRKLDNDNKTLSRNLETLEERLAAKDIPDTSSKAADSRRKRAQLVANQARQLFTDILSFKASVETNRPMVVLSPTSVELTERSLVSQAQFENNALMEFFRTFAGPIYEVKLTCRDQGIDTSSLDSHLVQLVNTQVLRLVAMDLKGMAEQLQKKEGRPE